MSVSSDFFYLFKTSTCFFYPLIICFIFQSTDGNANAITTSKVGQALISGLQARSGNSPVVLNAITSIQQMSPSLVVSARFNASKYITIHSWDPHQASKD